jgi:hypothetical protein
MPLIEQNDLRVQSWAELCERLYQGSWREEIGRFRSNFAFRGLGDKDYPLVTSFRRNYGDRAELEYHLLRNFAKYAQLGTIDLFRQSDWRWMTLAQHYGLPTRLLDWTYSPFVAMHFATSDTHRYDRDGVIWELDYVRANRLLPSPLVDELRDAGANVFTIDMLDKAVPEIRKFDRMAPGELLLFFEPPSLDARIVNQFAFFSVMSSPTANLEDWLLKHPDLFRRTIIPKGLKWEIRDKLDQANITERILFPGLDGLASWLRRHYQPRSCPAAGGELKRVEDLLTTYTLEKGR